MADHKQEYDAVTGMTTTGHEWDGVKELNTPLPRWWLWIFYATIVWSVGYWILYPAWPLVSSHTTGVLGYSSRASVAEDLAALQARRGERGKAVAAASLEDIRKTPELLGFAMAAGKAAFGDNCAPCHGSGATGSKGFPNLNDDDWIWGGTLADIEQTIRHGIRNERAETRTSQMPAFGRDGTLKRDEIAQVAAHTLSLSGVAPEPGVNVANGKKLFAENCAVCHGDDGKGNLELGAPNLTDRIWLYGGDKATVLDVITNSRGGVMPGWAGRLDDMTVKSLAVYVHALGGGT